MTTNTNASSSLSPETSIERSRHEANGIAIRYLGQVGFLLQHRGLTIVIDPYLTDSVDRLTEFKSDFWVRAYPPPVDPHTMKGIDLVLCTHDHMDHTDPETLAAIAAASPECRFAAPKQSVDVMIRAGIASDRVVVLNEGMPFPFRDVAIEPVAVAHEEYETDDEGNHRYLGYLLHWGGMTLFHAGDTVGTPRLAETLSRHSIDVGFLPVNGRDEARHQLGIIGNMDTAEAANFAADQGFKLVIPTHYDLYPNNGAALADFVTTWEQRPVSQRPKLKAFLPGEQIVYQNPTLIVK